MINPPPPLEELRLGAKLCAGLGTATVIADFDFETYSPAGYVWDYPTKKWGPLRGASKKGIGVVGAAAYTEHPQAEVLCLAYDLKDGKGRRQWTPEYALPPFDLLTYLKNGGLIEAWNIGFEYWVWTNICVPKYEWDPLNPSQLRCAMAKARAFGLPGKLADTGKVLNLAQQKDKEGKRLLEKFTRPRNPSKTDGRFRIKPSEDTDGAKLYAYNIQDIVTEAEASSLIPDLSSDELEFWKIDQAINRRGVQTDTIAISNCMSVIEQAHSKYNYELQQITGGQVKAASEIAKLAKWVNSQGVYCTSLKEELLNELLRRDDLPENVRRVLQIRSMIGSAAVKKLYAMANMTSEKGRLHDLFVYHSARTGRAAGTGPQPQNFPNSGPSVQHCGVCGSYSVHSSCAWCGVPGTKHKEWNAHAVENALETIATRDLSCVEYFWGNAVDAVSGCLRGLFIAAPGHDLICSDYKAIEAVVLAALAGEQWRMDVFNTHGLIYEMSASKITGIPFDDFLKYKKENDDQDHPMRKKVGKVAELASGYQGWIGAWKQFGADKFFNDDEIKNAILAWRKGSPAIVEMWGGQERNRRPELYGLEGAAIRAVLSPGSTHEYRGIKYLTQGNILYCRLLSGRYLTYHKPRLEPSTRPGLALSFEGWNTNPKNGAIGWHRMHTYGGKLTENVVQATARDILAYAIVNLERSGYPVVLHVHDEIVSEVPKGSATSVREFEDVMSRVPAWAFGWPIRASGGWRGERYRK